MDALEPRWTESTHGSCDHEEPFGPMTTFLYVHGTGDRAGKVNDALNRLKPTLEGALGPHPLAFCAWGEHLGTLHRERFETIPDVQERGGGRMAKDGDEEDKEVNLWALLYRDPLFELKLLSVSRPAGGGGSGIGRETPAQALTRIVKGLTETDELGRLLDRAGLRDDFEAARLRVAGSEAFQKAVATAPAASATRHREAIARAVLATAVLAVEGRGQVPAFQGDPALRAELITKLADALGPREGAMLSWLMTPFLRLGERYVQHNAGELAGLFYKKLGDILLYQAKGWAIRQAIADSVTSSLQEHGGPIVLLSHSLGGIAAFEMFLDPQVTRPWTPGDVALLVTAGSQAPFMCEINALQTLDIPDGRDAADRLPADFPPWLNLYDPRDLLSFLAEPVFSAQRVCDVRVESRQPFPQSHGAYWANPGTWQAIGRCLSAQVEPTGDAGPGNASA
jgi:hypothetical protein